MTHGTAVVLETGQLAEEVYSIWLQTPIAATARPGQFIMISPHSDSRLLMRPISICDTDPAEGRLRIVFRRVGAGTAELSRAGAGAVFACLGPLGNGFPTERAGGRKDIVLMGGGIGAPPLLFLAKELRRAGHTLPSLHTVLGYRSAAAGLFLTEEFEAEAEVFLATDDGSAGTGGTVLDALRAARIRPDIIFACGPLSMLKAVKSFAGESGCEAYISLEERMACGVGACLGCVVKTERPDAHTRVGNARICTEGPVFPASEVLL